MLQKLWGNFKSQSRKRKILYILTFLLAATILGILLLEIFARTCPLSQVRTKWPSCSDLIEKYAPESHYQFQSQSNSFLPQDPSTYENLEGIIENQVIYVPQEDLPGLNGISCYPHAFVSKDLPTYAKRYVATHEAIHLMGESNETRTNYLAGKQEPLGLVQTVLYSLFLGITKTPIHKYPCALGLMWQAFKMYFLNIPIDY